MGVAESLVWRARSMGASFDLRGNKVRVRAPHPLPTELVEGLRREREGVRAYLGEMKPHRDFECWTLAEWRRSSIPKWRDIREQARVDEDEHRLRYAEWMLSEILLDPECPEEGKDDD